MINQEIPDNVRIRAQRILQEAGFKHRVDLQAERMITETTEIVNAIGGRVVWD